MRRPFSLLAALGVAAGAVALLATHRVTAGSAPFDAPPPLDPALTPVLVELFTSEGCSSCPPADEELARIAHASPVAGVQVIPLAFHVDYWNDLGWPDPFSSSTMTDRQRGYAAALHRGQLYTPQAVVDGASDFTGGDDDAARRAIRAAAQVPKASVTLERRPGMPAAQSPYLVRVGPLGGAHAGDVAELVVVLTESGLRVEVPRGENRGRTLPHLAVVRQLQVVGVVPAAGGTLEASVPPIDPRQRNQMRVVAFVQERASRRVLGAGMIAP